MHVEILIVFQWEIRGRSTHIAFLIPISLHRPCNAGYEHIMSYIELPPLIQQRLLHIFLQYERSQTTIFILLPTLQPRLDLLQSKTYTYTITTISILTWLHYPYIFQLSVYLLFVLDLFVCCQKLLIFWILYSFGDVES